jgi:GT2 family glycosyltransferase
MPNTRPETLAVVVPATDDPPSLERCVAALREASHPPDELVVVDSPADLGPAAARNAGVEATTSDLIAFVDADVVIAPDALERLRGRFAADRELAAVFGAYDDAPEAPGAVSRFRNLLHHHVHASSPGPAETFWAGLGAVRREALVAAGGFDAERFPRPAIEDIELGMRLRRAGYEIVLDPEIRGTHLKRWSLASMLATDVQHRGAPWTRLQLERGETSSALNLGWRHRLSAAAAVLAAGAAILRRPRLALGAAAALVALNGPFYALLHRRGGIRLAVAGVGLHVVHHVSAVVSAVVGAAGHALARGRES